MKLTVYKNGSLLGHIDPETRTASDDVKPILSRLASTFHPTEPGWTEELQGWKSLGDDTYYVSKRSES